MARLSTVIFPQDIHSRTRALVELLTDDNWAKAVYEYSSFGIFMVFLFFLVPGIIFWE